MVANRYWRPALIGAVLAVLGACTAGGPAPLPSPSAAHAMLAATEYGPAKPRAVILAAHGFGDHGTSTFGRAAEAWAARGIATRAVDLRGFGRNPSRGVWPGADRLVADLRAETTKIRGRHPCVPLILLGHSMGGGLALAAAPALPLDGLVLAAPAIWGGDALNPLHRSAAWLAAFVAPQRRFTGRGVIRIQASDNIEMLRALARDPLRHGPPSARELMGLVRVTDRAAEAAPNVATPALLLLGERDQIVPNSAVERVFAQTAGPRDVHLYPAGWHMLFRDLQAPTVWQDVGDWTLARERPEGCTRPDAVLASRYG
ncbi:MAG: alpha/beta hydrolase [Pikeienuella sp.]